MTEKINGHCLCGAVKFTAEAASHNVTACHCNMCMRWAGGISLFLDVVGVPVFEGQDNIVVFRSSEWGERGFCKTCGSSLFWKVAGKDRYTLSAGVVDGQDKLVLAREIFVDDKPGYFDFANDTTKLTGEEAIAEYVG